MQITTITLKTPIDHDGKTYASVTIGEPTVAAVQALEKAAAAGEGDVGCTVALLEVATGIPADALHKMKISDFRTVADSLRPFVMALQEAALPSGDASPQTSPQS